MVLLSLVTWQAGGYYYLWFLDKLADTIIFGFLTSWGYNYLWFLGKLAGTIIFGSLTSWGYYYLWFLDKLTGTIIFGSLTSWGYYYLWMLDKLVGTTTFGSLTSWGYYYLRFLDKLSVLLSSRPLVFNPLNAEWNLICHLLALLGAHHILHVSRIRANNLNFTYQGPKTWSLIPPVENKLIV